MRVEVRMVERQGEVEEVVETDADGDGFEAEGFEGKFRRGGSNSYGERLGRD